MDEGEALGSPSFLVGVDKLERDIVKDLLKIEEVDNCKQFDKMNIKIMTVVATAGERNKVIWTGYRLQEMWCRQEMFPDFSGEGVCATSRGNLVEKLNGNGRGLNRFESESGCK